MHILKAPTKMRLQLTLRMCTNLIFSVLQSVENVQLTYRMVFFLKVSCHLILVGAENALSQHTATH